MWDAKKSPLLSIFFISSQLYYFLGAIYILLHQEITTDIFHAGHNILYKVRFGPHLFLVGINKIPVAYLALTRCPNVHIAGSKKMIFEEGLICGG